MNFLLNIHSVFCVFFVFFVKFLSFSFFDKNGSFIKPRNHLDFLSSPTLITSLGLFLLFFFIGSSPLLPLLLLISSIFFRKGVDTQLALLLYFSLVSFIFFKKDIILTILYLEIQFYYSLYIIVISFNTIVFKNNQVRVSSIMLPLVFMNFCSSWFLFIYSMVFSLFFATSDLYLYILASPNFVLFTIFICLFKLSLGPWFFNNFSVYKFMKVNTLVFLTISYFMYILPCFFNLIQLSCFKPQFILLLTLSFFFLIKDIFLNLNFKKILLVSSLLTFYFLSFILFTAI